MEGPSIWESAGEKWWAEYLGVGKAVVEDDDGLFVLECRRHDKVLRIVGCPGAYGISEGRHA